jgi:hypothetical protein
MPAVAGEASAPVLFAGTLCEVLFLFGASVLIVKSLFSARAPTFDSIFVAVCGYLPGVGVGRPLRADRGVPARLLRDRPGGLFGPV